MVNDVILGLDVSTACIGYCLFLDDEDKGSILKLGHVSPKVPNKTDKTEALFLKKKIFCDEFLLKYKDFNIKKVVIEEPLVMSNNANTVATLLRFNGMISDAVYNILDVVPTYISSYDARKFAFPSLMGVRKFKKNGSLNPTEKIIKDINKNNYTLFGSYPYDVSKKIVIWNKVNEIYTNIDWILDKKGELKKENFDATDALTACLGARNKEKYGEVNVETVDVSVNDNIIEYTVSYWGIKEKRIILL